jgi:uncharacterized protein YjbI with pentapeptide repeats
MATKRELVERWREPGGRERAERLFDAMERQAPSGELAEILSGLPHAEEVAPSMDMRGLEFRYVMTLSGLDLSGARLDRAKLIGNIRDCLLVGAVLDDFNGRNARMTGNDFTRASFKRARLNGCWFDGSVLREADLTRAQLEQASLRGCNCTGARFVEARVRFTTLIDTVLAGADLSGADFTESSLTGARFDGGIRVEGARFAGARLDEDFLHFAAAHGARVGAERHGFALALLDASAAILRRRNRDGRLDPVLTRIAQLRDNVVKDPDFDWIGVVEDEFPDDVVREVMEVVGEADVSEDR